MNWYDILPCSKECMLYRQCHVNNTPATDFSTTIEVYVANNSSRGVIHSISRSLSEAALAFSSQLPVVWNSISNAMSVTSFFLINDDCSGGSRTFAGALASRAAAVGAAAACASWTYSDSAISIRALEKCPSSRGFC